MNSANTQIDLFEFIETVKRQIKVILAIFLLSLGFSLGLYSLDKNNKSISYSNVFLQKPPISAFEAIDSFIKKKQSEEIYQTHNYFFKNLKINFLSVDTFMNFVNSYKKKHKAKNIEEKSYDSFQIKEIKKFDSAGHEIKNPVEFSFSYIGSDNFNGNEFLNNYAIFIYNQTLEEFYNEIQRLIEIEIEFLKENLKIASELNIDEPLSNGLTSAGENSFFVGTEILSLKIEKLEKDLKNLKQKKIDYNPIYREAFNFYKKQKPTSHVILIGLVSGFVISFFFIFLTSVNKKKNKNLRKTFK